MASLGSVVLACLLVASCAATKVEQCQNKNYENLSDNVQLTCPKIPCRLKKGTDQHITITFTPDKELKDIRNTVTAEVFTVPVPFVGVDGNSICDKLFNESGEKVSCPVKAGTKYVYKDSFPVLQFYPSINVRVHWALNGESKDDTLICFEVPARIA